VGAASRTCRTASAQVLHCRPQPTWESHMGAGRGGIYISSGVILIIVLVVLLLILL
jgi:hypothetical protein